MINTNYYKMYLSKLVEEGILEADEVEGLSDEELKKLATGFMDRADVYADMAKEDYGN